MVLTVLAHAFTYMVAVTIVFVPFYLLCQNIHANEILFTTV